MHMLQKRQMVVEAEDEGLTVTEHSATPSPRNLSTDRGNLPLHDLLSKICDTTGVTVGLLPYRPNHALRLLTRPYHSRRAGPKAA